MCGILAIYAKKDNRLSESEIVAMRDKMVHRGPDDAGLFMDLDNKLALAHRRLSILDLSRRAHQPMRSKNGNVICFNGEIYNYLELKRDFLKNEALESESDTSVLLHMLQNSGERALPLFNGMWAFIFYKPKEKELLISRDRDGIKPLYYYNDDEILILPLR